MEIDKKPLVIVLSRSYSTGLSVIRSLGTAGYTVDLIASAHKPGVFAIAAGSKYVRRFSEVISKKVKNSKNGGDDALVKELLKYAGEYEQKPVLFPTDDYTTSVMDMNRSVLEEHFIMPTITGGGDGCMTRCMDKTVQGEMAKKAGLHTPQEWIISLKGKVEIPEDMVYPCFCKPIESVTGYKREMATCQNSEELKKHLRKLKKAFSNRSILVQEFLEIDQEIDLSGVCLDQEIIIPAIIKKTHVAQYERGVTLAGRVVPFEEISEIRENVIAMLKQFHYVGMFDMELNVAGGKIYFNEVNLRSGGPNFSYFMSGVNLPALFVKEALGQRHTAEEEKVADYGKTFVYEKVAWEDYIHGFMTKKELEACIASADIKLLYNDEDPIPGKIFLKSMKQTMFKRRVKQMKKNARRQIKRWGKSFGKIRFLLWKGYRRIKEGLLGYPQTKKKNRRDPHAETPRVLVAGRNYCSNLCMARSLGEAGYEVEVLRIFQVKPKAKDLMKRIQPDAYSKYVKAYHMCISRRKSRRVVEKLIQLADPNHKMLLVPVDDLVAQIADEYMEELKPYYCLPNVGGKPGEISRLMNKNVQKELAIAAGLPVLNSCVVKTRKGKVRIPETVQYPCFVKPNISKNSSKSKMKRCDSKRELIATLKEYAQKKDVEMLVEDYVEIEKEYSLLGLSTRESVVAPGFFVAEKGGHKERRGVAMTGRILPCEQEQELIDALKRFVGSLDYEGLFDVDLIETSDGKLYFVELNLRYGASGYAVTKSGANLPGMFADYMLKNEPADLTCEIKEPGKQFISEKIMIDEYLNGFLTKEEVNECLKEADIHFVMSEEDPRPYKHFRKFYWVAGRKQRRDQAQERSELEKEKRKRKRNQRKKQVKRFIRQLVDRVLGYPQTKKKNQRDSDAVKPRVIVIGRNYCSNLCMARSLGEAGYEVEVLRIFKRKHKRLNLLAMIKPDAYSKYVKAYHVCVTNGKVWRVNKKLKELADPNRKMLLIPTDDFCAYIVDKYMKQLREYYFMPNIKQQAGIIGWLMHKDVQKRLAAKMGVPVLKGQVIKTEKRKFKIPKDITYPCFVKPNISKDATKRKMRICKNERQLKKTLKQFARNRDIEMLVEERVKVKKEYAILGLSAGADVALPGIVVTEKGGHKECRGIALTGRIISCEEHKEIVDAVRAFVASLKFEGLFDVDLIETEDGQIYFTEMNMRYGASGYAMTQGGVNLPGMFADYMVFQQPINSDCVLDEYGKSFINEKVLLDEYTKNYITTAEFKECLKTADVYFVKNERDKRPYRHFQKFRLIAAMMRVYKKVKA